MTAIPMNLIPFPQVKIKNGRVTVELEQIKHFQEIKQIRSLKRKPSYKQSENDNEKG